jgi:hypothetical protein
MTSVPSGRTVVASPLAPGDGTSPGNARPWRLLTSPTRLLSGAGNVFGAGGIVSPAWPSCCQESETRVSTESDSACPHE